MLATTARAARGGLLVVGAAVATGLVLRAFWAAGSGSFDAVAATGPDAPADLLVLGACGLGAVVATWLGLTVALATASALPGATGRLAGRLADHLAPVLVRRGVALVLGSALVAGIPAAAHADTPHPVPTATQVAPAPDPAFAVTSGGPAVDGSTTPRPSTTTTATPTSAPDPGFSATTENAPPPRPAPSLGPLGPAPRPPVSADAQPSASTSSTSPAVHVARGDTLWGIAARHLGPSALAASIAREWPRWYAANRAVIGADPNLILVGQVLNPPPAGPISTSTPTPTQGAAS